MLACLVDATPGFISLNLEILLRKGQKSYRLPFSCVFILSRCQFLNLVYDFRLIPYESGFVLHNFFQVYEESYCKLYKLT